MFKCSNVQNVPAWMDIYKKRMYACPVHHDLIHPIPSYHPGYHIFLSPPRGTSFPMIGANALDFIRFFNLIVISLFPFLILVSPF